jgi:16S rRNA (adenine1518-N6/adenine1519-N6)-dimethyltransferase
VADPLPSLPPLREIIKTWELDADKRLGQHFLLDLNLTGRIARAAGDLTGVNIIEIGPGPGGLTRAILECGAQQVIAIERDPRCVAALQSLAGVANGRLTVIEADALKVDPAALVPAPRAIIANLPYNVASPLLIGWLKQASAFTSLTLMFQREVALRLVATPRSKAYGRLSVMTQWLTEATLVFDVPAAAFTPPPKIVSSIVRLVPRDMDGGEPAFAAMERVVAAAFGQRRKMLRAALRSLVPDPLALLETAEIEPTARAEELDVPAFRRLALAWAADRTSLQS